MPSEYTIAKYIRLSADDAKSDSISIENQRLILNKHIADMDYTDAAVMEFVDNGYTGTNFERPAVQELIELVRQGSINCITVKDISRFGRDMIDTGYYLELVLPLYGVRFVSVSDCYDSADHDGDTGGMDIALKLLVHEQYSRDLSSKIKTSMRAQALRGEYIPENCIFGYKKVDSRLEIDKPAAETVRFIFNLAKTGKGTEEIRQHLYDKKLPTPSMHSGKAKHSGYIWHRSSIRSILRNEQYTGTYIYGKRKTSEVGSGRTVMVDESDWVKIPAHHPAIIEKAVFDAVREMKQSNGEPLCNRSPGTPQRYRHQSNPLKGKVVCGCCGYVMPQSNSKNIVFHCNFTRVATDAQCHSLGIGLAELEMLVMKSIQKQSQGILKKAGSRPALPEHPSGYAERIAVMDDAKCKLYESYVLGEINAAEYMAEKSRIDTEQSKMKQLKAAYMREAEENSMYGGYCKIATDALREKTLTKQLADELIDKILVFPENRIEIVWKIPEYGTIDTDGA